MKVVNMRIRLKLAVFVLRKLKLFVSLTVNDK